MVGQRIVIIGPSGAGKSTLARALSRRGGRALLELDSIHHLAGWKTRPDAEAREEIRRFMANEPRWVIDGNYLRHREVIWRAADTIIWIDLPRAVVMTSLVGRTLRRLTRREVLWNGNRERWREVLSFDPQRSIVTWGWTTFDSCRAELAAAMADSAWSHSRWLRLRSRAEVRACARNA